MANIHVTSRYIKSGIYIGGHMYSYNNGIKDYSGMTREEFLKEVSSRDVDGVCNGYEFWLSYDKVWEISPSNLSVDGFYGPIHDALDSDLVPENLKTFLIFNLELFS